MPVRVDFYTNEAGGGDSPCYVQSWIIVHEGLCIATLIGVFNFTAFLTEIRIARHLIFIHVSLKPS